MILIMLLELYIASKYIVETRYHPVLVITKSASRKIKLCFLASCFCCTVTFCALYKCLRAIAWCPFRPLDRIQGRTIVRRHCEGSHSSTLYSWACKWRMDSPKIAWGHTKRGVLRSVFMQMVWRQESACLNMQGAFSRRQPYNRRLWFRNHISSSYLSAVPALNFALPLSH